MGYCTKRAEQRACPVGGSCRQRHGYYTVQLASAGLDQGAKEGEGDELPWLPSLPACKIPEVQTHLAPRKLPVGFISLLDRQVRAQGESVPCSGSLATASVSKPRNRDLALTGERNIAPLEMGGPLEITQAPLPTTRCLLGFPERETKAQRGEDICPIHERAGTPSEDS